MLGDLTKLLQYGNVTTNCEIKTEDDQVFTFKLRTLTPLEDADCREKASKVGDQKFMSYYTAYLFCRAIESINGTPLEDIPAAVGSTPDERRLSVVQKLGQVFMMPLQKSYAELLNRIMIDDSAKDEELKK